MQPSVASSTFLLGELFYRTRSESIFMLYVGYFFSIIVAHALDQRSRSHLACGDCQGPSLALSLSLALSFTVYLRPDPAWPGLSALSTSPVWSGTVHSVDRCGNVALCGTRNRVVNVVGQMDVYCLVNYRRVHRYFFALFLWHYYLYLRSVFFSFFIFFCVFTLNWM